MMASVKFNNSVWILCFALVLCLTVLVYLPGLQGGFLFDDYPNLSEMGANGGVVDFETFKSFVFHGVSSSLGRPLALASFLLDDNTWPSNAIWFKTTNLKIHLLAGIALCLATLNLMRLFERSEPEAAWIALLSCAIWLLHPYMLSTTLYVVQRMAQLAALFVLAGLAAYFHGRLLLQKGKVRVGYIWMSLSLGLATPLAILSKENGILLPCLVLAVEYCLPKNKITELNFWWRAAFLWLPTLVVIFILANAINFSPDAWPARSFTQPERLLTEARIIWEYLYHLYVPRIEGRGLFQDGYAFSRGLLSPPITSLAIVLLGSLIVFVIRMRSRFPFFCVGILFFLVAHLLESTFIGLELYFEHRNYLASAFLFLPLAGILVGLQRQKKLWISIIGAVSLLGMLSFLTWERSKLWSDTQRLELYWAVSSPKSPRAQNQIAAAMIKAGDSHGAMDHLHQSMKTFPQNTFLSLSYLILRVDNQLAIEQDFKEVGLRAKDKVLDAQTLVGLRILVDRVRKKPNDTKYVKYALSLIDYIDLMQKSKNNHFFNKIKSYLRANLYLGLGEYNLAYNEFKEAIIVQADTDAGFNMVAEMANAGRPFEALMLLKENEKIYRNQSEATLKRSRNTYDEEFSRFYGILQAETRSLIGDGVVPLSNIQ